MLRNGEQFRASILRFVKKAAGLGERAMQR